MRGDLDLLQTSLLGREPLTRSGSGWLNVLGGEGAVIGLPGSVVVGCGDVGRFIAESSELLSKSTALSLVLTRPFCICACAIACTMRIAGPNSMVCCCCCGEELSLLDTCEVDDMVIGAREGHEQKFNLWHPLLQMCGPQLCLSTRRSVFCCSSGYRGLPSVSASTPGV